MYYLSVETEPLKSRLPVHLKMLKSNPAFIIHLETWKQWILELVYWGLKRKKKTNQWTLSSVSKFFQPLSSSSSSLHLTLFSFCGLSGVGWAIQYLQFWVIPRIYGDQIFSLKALLFVIFCISAVSRCPTVDWNPIVKRAIQTHGKNKLLPRCPTGWEMGGSRLSLDRG